MDSRRNEPCSHDSGCPIRKSPDHRMLASSRGLSQLATSFIAYSRQGIHTHALSSLTIKFTPGTKPTSKFHRRLFAPHLRESATRWVALHRDGELVAVYPSIFSFQRSSPGMSYRHPASESPARGRKFGKHCDGLVGLGRFELPTSPLSGVRSNQLSYRPVFGAATGRWFATLNWPPLVLQSNTWWS